MRRPTKQDVLGDWSVTDWLYALAGLCCGFLLILCFVLLLPAPE